MPEREEGDVCGRRYTAPEYDEYGGRTQIVVVCNGIVGMVHSDRGPRLPNPYLGCLKCQWSYEPKKRPGSHEYQPDIYDKALEELKKIKEYLIEYVDAAFPDSSAGAAVLLTAVMSILDVLIKEREEIEGIEGE